MKFLLPVLTFLVACSAPRAPVTTQPHPPARAEDYPWALHDVQEFPQNFMWEQRLTAQTAQSHGSVRVVVQKMANDLTVVGLTPFATKAFVLTQKGQTVDFQMLVDREMPFPPRFILIDFQRTWLSFGDPQAHPRTGVELLDVGEEKLKQTWQAGRLVERRFTRKSGVPAGEIVIAYADWQGDGIARQVRIDNWWFGYRLDVETLSQRNLP